MAISTFDLTEHTQFCIRSTTGSHPDSEYVFGVYMDTDTSFGDDKGFAFDFTMYDGVDWERAVDLAKWIIKWDERFRGVKE